MCPFRFSVTVVSGWTARDWFVGAVIVDVSVTVPDVWNALTRSVHGAAKVKRVVSAKVVDVPLDVVTVTATVPAT